ncbi:MAG: sporulation peptidase YabG [Peptococcaceae bacterium]|nr:sporulation peptidase YabG [Peptococcaceae bacterium]
MAGRIAPGDVVARISHQQDILFRVMEICTVEGKGTQAILKGLDVRLAADAPLSDLVKKNPSEISRSRQAYIRKNSDLMRRIFERRAEDHSRVFMRGPFSTVIAGSQERDFFELPGTVLHLDGDKEYLDICRATYSQLGIKANTLSVSEKKQPEVVIDYLKQYKPDILILTGHDGLIKNNKEFRDIKNYRHSRYFAEAVIKAREYEPNRDDLIIFAGACQSHYEALIDAGANFASSPGRVLIHAFDPVFLAEKLAYTSIFDVLSLRDILSNTITGTEGVGGIETRGCLRLGFPKGSY